MRQIPTRPDASRPDMAGVHAVTEAEYLADLASSDLIAGRERTERGGPSR